MKKKALQKLAEQLEPAILAGGYARIIMKGYPLTITHGEVWRAALAFEPDLEMKWTASTLFALLEEGVRAQACPFDETRFSEWEVGSPARERRFQAFLRERSTKSPALVSAPKQQAPLLIHPAPSGAPYEPAHCLHCDGEIPLDLSLKGKAYCCDRCSEVAAIVRSARVSLKNGKYHEKTFDGKPSMTRMVTDLKIAFVSFGDGYPKKARYLTPAQKQAIMRRDNGICQMCGSYATDIDHIKGSSPDPSNLRALCKNCNVTRAIAKLPVLTPEQEKRKAEIWRAIRARRPLRLCHDEQLWKHIWQRVMAIHRDIPTQAERDRLLEQLASRYYE